MSDSEQTFQKRIQKRKQDDFDDGADDGSESVDNVLDDEQISDPEKILFFVSDKGRIKKTLSGVTTFGHVSRGYMRYGSICRIYVHLAICYKFKGPCPPEKTTVDHIDGDTKNNAIGNLQWATQSEQVQNSWSRNGKRKAGNRATSKPVEACKIDETPEVWIYYPTVQAAADGCKTYQGGVSNVCAGRTKSSGGFKFRFADTGVLPLLEGEEWRTAVIDGVKVGGWHVSNLGRVKSATGITSFGSKDVDDYFKISSEGSNYPVHLLVMHSFLGPPPSDMLLPTVDHIDRNPSNNAFSNLRWATKTEQTANRVFSKPSGPKIALFDRKIDLPGERWEPFYVKDFNALRDMPKPPRNQEQKAENRKKYRQERAEKNKLLQKK